MADCSGNCGACSGCGRSLELTHKEIEFLKRMGQIPFLPVGKQTSDEKPLDPEDPSEERSLLLQVLEKKGLISLDYDMPLRGVTDPAYEAFRIRGSMALTARGQQVLELLEIQGAE